MGQWLNDEVEHIRRPSHVRADFKQTTDSIHLCRISTAYRPHIDRISTWVYLLMGTALDHRNGTLNTTQLCYAPICADLFALHLALDLTAMSRSRGRVVPSCVEYATCVENPPAGY